MAISTSSEIRNAEIEAAASAGDVIAAAIRPPILSNWLKAARLLAAPTATSE